MTAVRRPPPPATTPRRKKAKPCPLTVRIDKREDFGIDEIVAANAFVHLERMNTNFYWMRVTTPHGSIDVHIGASRAKVVTHEVGRSGKVSK